jgi:signal transduction histidine kinase
MIPAPIPEDDALRLHDLYELGILDTEEEEEFNEVVELASRICHTPISLISLVDFNRQWFKAAKGVSAKQTRRDISFCGHAILMDNPFFEVEDAWEDIRFADNPMVLNNPHIRYYAGVQLLSKNGARIGMLCVNDTKPNKLNEEQVLALKVLANHVSKMIDLRLAKKQLEEKNRELEARSEVHTKMISIIAHDVRGPIGSLKNFFELAEQQTIDPESKQVLMNMCRSQVDITLSLLNNLVEWASLISKEPSATDKPVPVAALVQNEINQLMPAASFKHNQLVNLVDEKFQLEIDPNLLQFIIRNLLANANKFTEKGKVMVYADTDASGRLLVVKDTGVGMTADMLHKLISEDKMITTQGTQNEKGSGFGLRMVKEFMRKAGGQVELKSEWGKGTSVLLRFPGKKEKARVLDMERRA